MASEVEDPVGREFRRVMDQIRLGKNLDEALEETAQRIDSPEFKFFVISLAIQRETGGNLAEILEQISGVIRSRFRFYRKVRTLSAEGRLSAWILAMVPFALFAVITFTTAESLPVMLEDPTGRQLVGFGFVAGVVGIFWIRRIIRIEA